MCSSDLQATEQHLHFECKSSAEIKIRFPGMSGRNFSAYNVTHIHDLASSTYTAGFTLTLGGPGGLAAENYTHIQCVEKKTDKLLYYWEYTIYNYSKYLLHLRSSLFNILIVKPVNTLVIHFRPKLNYVVRVRRGKPLLRMLCSGRGVRHRGGARFFALRDGDGVQDTKSLFDTAGVPQSTRALGGNDVRRSLCIHSSNEYEYKWACSCFWRPELRRRRICVPSVKIVRFLHGWS